MAARAMPGMWRELWFETQLSVDECKLRLMETLDPKLKPFMRRSKGAFGDLTADGFWAMRPSWLAAASPYVKARLEPQGSGAIVRGLFGVQPVVRAALYIFAVSAILLGAWLLGVLVTDDQSARKVFFEVPWQLLSIASGGAVMIGAAVFLSRSNQTEIVDLLKLTLDARLRGDSPHLRSYQAAESTEPYVKPWP